MDGNKVCDIYGLNTVKGDLGIEIEVEGNRTFPLVTSHNWRCEADGSLRGHSMEYIIENPIFINQVDDHISFLLDLIRSASVRVHDSFRAGVHVHLNVQRLTLFQVGNLAAIYYILETALVKYCGDRREGNYHCLRREDAEYSYEMLCHVLRGKNYALLGTDELRYAAMNLRAISRYGSIEFRSMATKPGFEQIKPWCEILCRIKDYAVTVNARTDLAYDFSMKGPELWATDIIGEKLYKLIAYEGIEKDMTRNMRQCQMLIFLGDTNVPDAYLLGRYK